MNVVKTEISLIDDSWLNPKGYIMGNQHHFGSTTIPDGSTFKRMERTDI